MAWKGIESEQIGFIDLLSVLVNSKIQQTNPPLYQVISLLLSRLGKNKDLVINELQQLQNQIITIGDTIINISGTTSNITLATYLTTNDETALLPNSVQLLEGTGITFNDAIPNKRYISASLSGSSVAVLPMVNGEEPPQLLSNGNGDLIIIPFVL